MSEVVLEGCTYEQGGPTTAARCTSMQHSSGPSVRCYAECGVCVSRLMIAPASISMRPRQLCVITICVQFEALLQVWPEAGSALDPQSEFLTSLVS